MRNKYLNDAEEMIKRLGIEIDKELLKRLTELLYELEEEGTVLFSIKNIRLQREIEKVMNEIIEKTGEDVGKLVLEIFEKQDENVKNYFEFIDRFDNRAYTKSRKLVREWLGVSGTKIKKDTRLGNIIYGTSYGRTVSNILSSSMGRLTVSETIDAIVRTVSSGRLAMRTQELYYATMDLFANYDRAVTSEVAKEVGLKHAIYQGGVIENTRKFCEDRNNKVFTREEIEDWRNLEFQGKTTPYDPITDLGGYNCRHLLDWISEELAKELRPDLKDV